MREKRERTEGFAYVLGAVGCGREALRPQPDESLVTTAQEE